VARAVGHRWPQAAPRDLGDALSTLLPLVQVPPRGLWRQTAPAKNTTIRAWLRAEPAEHTPDVAEALVLRYLARSVLRRPPTSGDLSAPEVLRPVDAVGRPRVGGHPDAHVLR
jgi:hypothetical protein